MPAEAPASGIEAMLKALMANVETLMKRPVVTGNMIKEHMDRYVKDTIDPRLLSANLVNQKAIDDSKTHIWNGLKGVVDTKMDKTDCENRLTVLEERIKEVGEIASTRAGSGASTGASSNGSGLSFASSSTDTPPDQREGAVMGNLGDGSLDRDEVKAVVGRCLTEAGVALASVRCVDPMSQHQNMRYNMATVLFNSARERAAAQMLLSAAALTMPGCSRTVWLSHSKTESERKPSKLLNILYKRLANTNSGRSHANLEYDRTSCEILLDDRTIAYVDLCGTGGQGSRIVFTDWAKEKFDQHELAQAQSYAEQKC